MRDSRPGAVVDWTAGERRRRDLSAELERITRALPDLGVKRALLFGSLARGEVRGQSDLDLILIVDTGEPSSGTPSLTWLPSAQRSTRSSRT